jgi:tetratricopeptide (TPR) repeat protein
MMPNLPDIPLPSTTQEWLLLVAALFAIVILMPVTTFAIQGNENNVSLEHLASDQNDFWKDLGNLSSIIQIFSCIIVIFVVIWGIKKYGWRYIASRITPKRPEIEDYEQKKPGNKISNLPYPRNLNFTGRESLLANLRAVLDSGDTVALTAITGLGGIGKTQLALEYSYLFWDEYDVIWWVRSEEPATLAADYAMLAKYLNLPEKDAADQTLTINAVKRWLENNSEWLLVFDSAQNPHDLKRYVPRSRANHIIITSRNPDWSGTAKPLTVIIFDRNESIAFLIKRTEQNDEKAANALAETLGDLPLALEQAGAYILAAAISISDYLERFNEQHKRILESRLGNDIYYPDTIATTWGVSFQAVQKESPVSAEILWLCSFLAPDDIPRSLLVEGAKYLPEPLASVSSDDLMLDAAIWTLRRYSLINVTIGGFSIHRLVQMVTRDRMTADDRKKWALIAVNILSEVFPIKSDDPESIDAHLWHKSSCLTSHALAASSYALDFNVSLMQISNLLNQSGSYLRERAQLLEAKELHEQALVLAEKSEGRNHPSVAICLENLARVLRDMGHLQKAQEYLKRAIDIEENYFGSGTNISHIAICLDNLGRVLYSQGNLADAKKNYKRALKIDEKIYGQEHPRVAIRLNNIGAILQEQGNLVGAKKNYERALEIDKKFYGQDNPYVAIRLNNLGMILYEQGDLDGAKKNLETALEINKNFYGVDHPLTQTTLNNLKCIRFLGPYKRLLMWIFKILHFNSSNKD